MSDVASTAEAGPACVFCGQEPVLEIAEIWSDHRFMIETCREAAVEAFGVGDDALAPKPTRSAA